MKEGLVFMRADYIDPNILDHIFAALMPQNELAMRVSLATGLRIDDVLSIRTEKLMNTKNQRITVFEHKTGKTRRVYIPTQLFTQMIAFAGRFYVFEGRTNPRKHRTRQAVYKDLKRAAAAFRVTSLNVSPHSARKTFACEAFKKYGDPKKVQALLNHGEEHITALYLIAESVSQKKMDCKTDPRRGR